MYKIIGSDGKEYGPITAEQLRQWITEGRANSQTRVLLEGTTDWRKLGEMAEFAALLAAPPLSAGGPPAEKVPNCLVHSILATLCCCLPFGIVAIVYAAQVNTKFNVGDYPGALEASRKAKCGAGLLLALVWSSMSSWESFNSPPSCKRGIKCNGSSCP